MTRYEVWKTFVVYSKICFNSTYVHNVTNRYDKPVDMQFDELFLNWRKVCHRTYSFFYSFSNSQRLKSSNTILILQALLFGKILRLSDVNKKFPRIERQKKKNNTCKTSLTDPNYFCYDNNNWRRCVFCEKNIASMMTTRRVGPYLSGRSTNFR